MHDLRAKILERVRCGDIPHAHLWDKFVDHIKNKTSPSSTGEHCQSEDLDQQSPANSDHSHYSRTNPLSRKVWRLEEEEEEASYKMNFVHALLYGLSSIPRRGLPGRITEFGVDTFCVAATNKGDCFEAAALYGSGRIVTFSHNAYVFDITESPSNQEQTRGNRLLLNALLWSSSSECMLTDDSTCNALCERETDVTNYPFNWGRECQQPVVIAGLGYSEKKFESIVRALDAMANDVFVKGPVFSRPTADNIDSLIAARPHVILWTNSDPELETVSGSNHELDPRAEALLLYIHQGGGLVLGLCPWGWASIAKVSVTEQSLFNQVTSRLGIVLIGSGVDGFPNEGLPVEPALEAGALPNKIVQMNQTFDELISSAEVDIENFKGLLHTYMSCPASTFLSESASSRAWLPVGNSKMREVVARFESVALNLGQHTLSFPLATGKGASRITQANAAAMIYLTWLRRMTEVKPPASLSAYVPTVETFPGAVGSGERNSGLITSILNARKNWQTLGVYVAPGEAVTITISDQSLAAFPDLRLEVQIGSHTDELAVMKDNYKLNRHPRLVSKRSWTPRVITDMDREPMSITAHESNSVEVGSVYGGILYITVNNNFSKNTPEPIVFNVVGGVPIPYYNHMKERRNIDANDILYGKFGDSTDSYPFWSSSWEQRVSNFVDAPWTDLEGRYVSFTLPISALQTFTQQEIWDLMDFWDTVLYHELLLSGDIVDFEYSQERLACDEQISAGYMHSGYPVMCFMDVITPQGGQERPELLDLPRLKSYPMWGVYHEFGHNRQKNAWTWDDMVEVTVNIFSLYICHIMNGYDVWSAPWYQLQFDDTITYLSDIHGNRSLKDEAGVALGPFAMYIQNLADWQVIQKIFKTYRDQNIKPGSDDDKASEWIKQTSLAINTDLRPYYEQWGWRIDNGYLSELNRLPKWNGHVLEIYKAAAGRS